MGWVGVQSEDVAAFLEIREARHRRYFQTLLQLYLCLRGGDANE